MEVTILGILAFCSYMAGPNVAYNYSCAIYADLDKDGDVDLRDFAILQNEWSCFNSDCGQLRWWEKQLRK